MLRILSHVTLYWWVWPTGSPSILRLLFSIANAIHLTIWRSLSLSYWHYFYNSSGKIFWPVKHLRLKRKHLVIQLSSFLAHNRPHVARWTNQQTCGYNVNDEEGWGKTSIFLKMIYQWQTSQKSLFSKKLWKHSWEFCVLSAFILINISLVIKTLPFSNCTSSMEKK